MSNTGRKIKTAGNNIIGSKPPSTKNQQNKINNFNQNSKNPKNKKPSTPSINQRERNILLVQGSNQLPGNGLWCQIPKSKIINDTPYESIIPKIKAESELLNDPEKAADKKLINELKNQLKDLSLKLQDSLLKCSDAEFRAQRSENLYKNVLEELSNQKNEFNNIKENAVSMGTNVDELNEALNNAKKEIFRLQNDVNNEIAKNKELNLKIEKLLIEKDKNNYNNSEEITKLKKNIEKLQLEKENLIKIIQTKTNKENDNNIDLILNEKLKQKDGLLKSMETTMNKALNENAELKKKLNAEENNKIILNNIIAKKNEINEDLKAQIEAMKNYVDNNLKEVKWNQNKVNQKESNIKLMKEKIKKKDEEINNLNKKIENLNKKLNNKKKDTNENNNTNNTNNNTNNINSNLLNEQQQIISNKDGEKEILIPVKAKPFLFGPETNNYDYVDADLEKDIFG